MLSSTSNSEQALSPLFGVLHGGKGRRAIWAIVVGLVLIALSAEFATVFAVPRASKILRRTEQEFSDAEALHSYSQTGKPTMLLLGNSLLLEGVDYPKVKSGLANEFDVHRAVFEQTEYLEQYYVLRTLFRDGARPHDVVLCDSVSHFIADGTRGEFMARYIDAPDVTSLGLREHADATTLSGMMFAHWSAWYAYRAETRKAILGAFLPDMKDLAIQLGWRRIEPVSAEVVRDKSIPRLWEIKELCDRYGARLTILVLPSPWDDHPDVLSSFGKTVGVNVLVPEQPGALGEALYRDGMHLTPSGAAVFTAKLQTELANPVR